MKKNIVLIQSHCNTEERKNILIENLNKLKKLNLDLLLYSHIPLPQEIVEKVDYFIFDNSNPIMWDERRHYYWWANNHYKLETTVPDYGWTVFNQIIGGFELIKSKNYEHVIVFCYDVVIDETVESFLINPKSQIFEHHKPSVVFKTALIFFILKKSEFEILISSLSREEYARRYDLIAEKYFEDSLKNLNLYYSPNHYVFDSIHESKNIFNQSSDLGYEIFIDTTEKLKFIFTKKTQEKIRVIINDQVITVDNNQLIFSKKIDNLEVFGCLIENSFQNWMELFQEKRINKITFK